MIKFRFFTQIRKEKSGKKEIKKKDMPEKTESAIDHIINPQEEKPPPKKELSEVVEKVHEEIKEKKEEAPKKSSDYQPIKSDYSNYNPEKDVPQPTPSSEPVLVDDDLTAHRLRKDTDPLEYIKLDKYAKPWGNPFLDYIKDSIDDRTKRFMALSKIGFRSTINNLVGMYHTLFSWLYRKQ